MSLEEYIKSKNDNQKIKSNIETEVIDASKIKQRILEAVKNRISEERDIDLEQAEKTVRELAWRWIEEEADLQSKKITITAQQKYEMLEELIQNMFGYGVIDPFIKDKDITEIMINGPKNIFIEKKGRLCRAEDQQGNYLQFNSNEELKNVIDKIVAPINRKVDESDPIVDARLPDGSRVNIVLNPIALDGAAVTIRKFPENPYTMEQLVFFGSLPSHVAELLEQMVKARYNIIVSGGTGSGKTTFLNSLSMFIPNDSRVVTVEDAAELKFSQVENLVRMETRPPNLENKGQIAMRDLVRTALRMRPDRIIVGEVRGGEALDMLQAMNTGHDGSLSTGHANSARDMLMRLETMVLMAGMQLPVISIRQQIASAVDFIIHLSKLRDGSRRVVQVTEVLGIEDSEIITQDVFVFKEKLVKQTHQGIQINGQLERTDYDIQQTYKFMSAGIYDYMKYLEGEKPC